MKNKGKSNTKIKYKGVCVLGNGFNANNKVWLSYLDRVTPGFKGRDVRA
jgi:hypothetical protein